MCGIAGFISNQKDNNINLKNLGRVFVQFLIIEVQMIKGFGLMNNKKTLLAHTTIIYFRS